MSINFARLFNDFTEKNGTSRVIGERDVMESRLIQITRVKR